MGSGKQFEIKIDVWSSGCAGQDCRNKDYSQNLDGIEIFASETCCNTSMCNSFAEAKKLLRNNASSKNSLFYLKFFFASSSLLFLNFFSLF